LKRINKSDEQEIVITKAIIDICNKHKRRYGYRRVTMELRCKYNLVINHKKVLRIMKENDVLCVTKKKAKYKSYHGEVGKIAVNKLERNFTSNKPFKKICTDVTEFKVGEKRQYLSCAIDLYSRKIIGYSLSSSPTVDFVMDSIKPFI